jgi:hypothetical protein
VTIYEHPGGVVHAAESGFEGVACVDDTARLLGVLCEVYDRTQLPWVERWARGLLEFVLWMQEPDGRWLNFVHDWEGDKNRDGITSRTGQNFWQARGLLGVGDAARVLGDERAVAAFARGFAVVRDEPAPPDIRSLHLLAELARPEPDRALVRRWADEIASTRDGDTLMNSSLERGRPHLWAHIQEGVLARSAGALGDAELLAIAVSSAEAVLAPSVGAAFGAQASSSPYDVASCAWSLERLAEETDDERWVALAADALAWFDGRNAAGQPVYDRARGRVGDGVDEDRVSENSGAEANIVAAEVMLDQAAAIARDMPDPLGS